mmetsp:Transcript_3026/g.6191  ORF Transcript_3026/g.6191 Transcript_3026/m.6191 type:complete len:269 (-) Transcript_3026:727-1533(-)
MAGSFLVVCQFAHVTLPPRKIQRSTTHASTQILGVRKCVAPHFFRSPSFCKSPPQQQANQTQRMKSNQIEAIAFLLWVLPHAALSQATLPLSTGNLRRTAPKQKGRGAKTPAAVDHPPASADVKVVEYIPPISDNSEEDEDDPYVHVTIGFSDLEATSEIPSFVLPTLPIEEQTHLIANQVLAVANDADVEIVVPEIKTVTVKCHRSVRVIAIQGILRVDHANPMPCFLRKSKRSRRSTMSSTSSWTKPFMKTISILLERRSRKVCRR